MIFGVLVWIFPETFLSKIFTKKDNQNEEPIHYVANEGGVTGRKRNLKLAITLYSLVIANRNSELDFEALGLKNSLVLSFLETFKNVEEEIVRVSSIRFIQNLSNKQLDTLFKDFSIVNKNFIGLPIDPNVQMNTFSELLKSMEKFKFFSSDSDDSTMMFEGDLSTSIFNEINDGYVEQLNVFKNSTDSDLFTTFTSNGFDSLSGSDFTNSNDSFSSHDSFTDSDSYRGYDSFND